MIKIAIRNKCTYRLPDGKLGTVSVDGPTIVISIVGTGEQIVVNIEAATTAELERVR